MVHRNGCEFCFLFWMIWARRRKLGVVGKGLGHGMDDGWIGEMESDARPEMTMTWEMMMTT